MDLHAPSYPLSPEPELLGSQVTQLVVKYLLISQAECLPLPFQRSAKVHTLLMSDSPFEQVPYPEVFRSEGKMAGV